VHALNVSDLRRAAGALTRVLRVTDTMRPSVIQTWLPHADFVGAILGTLRPRIPVIWNIRMTDMALERKTTRILARRVNAYLSRLIPKAIVCCAQEAVEEFCAYGYARGKMAAIPNGFDLDAFTPSAVARAEARAALGVRSDELLVGIVGRFHPMKDHRTFVSAAAVARKSLANLRILMVGEGLGPENGVLDEWLHTAGMRDAC